MKLTTATIRRFRSIDEVDLSECGQLNVLIGKNNSGKSNVLSAVQLFFDFLKTDSPIASVNSPISSHTDWFGRDTNHPVIISLALELSQDEMTVVREAISREAPQMRNALDEVSTITTIECELTFHYSPLVGFVSRLAFSSVPGGSEYRIFGLDVRAATEIGSRAWEARNLDAQVKAIERYSTRLEQSDFDSIRERGRIAPTTAARLRAMADLSEEVNSVIVQLARSSDSYSEFRDRITTYSSDLLGQAANLRSSENEVKVATFSGESAVVPKYATTILGLISRLKVHHLSEQRKSIGQDEANRILRLKTSRGQGHVLRDIQSTVSQLLGVQIDAFSSDQQPERASAMAAELDVDDFLVQVNGSGVREALRLILDYEFERPDILMVEEPEVHLHPALEIAMMQYLRRISSGLSDISDYSLH
jgi:putative ATP-dependent endonuclease of the OLD family